MYTYIHIYTYIYIWWPGGWVDRRSVNVHANTAKRIERKINQNLRASTRARFELKPNQVVFIFNCVVVLLSVVRFAENTVLYYKYA